MDKHRMNPLLHTRPWDLARSDWSEVAPWTSGDFEFMYWEYERPHWEYEGGGYKLAEDAKKQGVEGDEDANNITGNSKNNILLGGIGEDALYGLGGDDSFVGGADADYLHGGAGEDTAIYYGGGGVTIDLAAGRGWGNSAEGDILDSIEHVIGTQYSDVLTGNEAGNLLSGNNGQDILRGGEGDDLLIGGADSDILDGGEGVDTIDYLSSWGGVWVNLSEGRATGAHAEGDVLTSIENVIGSNHGDTLIGNDENNWLASQAGNDHLIGGGGNDILEGGAGADLLEGGEGVDTADYLDSNGGVWVDLSEGYASGHYGDGDVLRSIENVIGSRHGDTLIGTEGNNRLEGDGGNDTLIGGDGDDVIEGGAGTDTIDGGRGNDTASYASSDAGVTVSLLNGYTAGGHSQGDRLSGIDNLIGSAYNDYLHGNGNSNFLSGGAGSDSLWGLGGDDVLSGGESADRLEGGDGTDTADYSASSAGVVASLKGRWIEGGWAETGEPMYVPDKGSGGDAEGDVLYTIENLRGSAHQDVLDGNEFANRLEGGSGSDTLRGGAGDDVLVGGKDADILDGGDGEDTADYSASDARVDLNIDLEIGKGLGGDARGDQLISIEHLIGSSYNDALRGQEDHGNILSGLAGNDMLDGRGGDDTLDGGIGNDILIGGAGADVLRGGAGSDSFIFKSEFGNDRIEDFNGAEGDVLEFEQSHFANAEAVLAAAVQSGSDVIIRVDSDTSVTLSNTQLSSLDAGDFRLA